MKHLSTLAIGLLIGTAAFQLCNPASGQSEGGWVTLLDSPGWATGMRSAKPIGR